MILIDIAIFIGHLHPLLVHLPIGLLLLAILLNGLSYHSEFKYVSSSIPIVLTLGVISACLSAITGYVLSLSGEYDNEVLSNHQTAGFVTTMISIVLMVITSGPFQIRFPLRRNIISVVFLILFVFVVYTGHQGGSLTHGRDYLSFQKLGQDEFEKPSRFEEAMVYEHVIYPLLTRRCAQCHGADKRKGKLSLQSMETILKGGKNGAVVISGKPDDSELYHRITLDPEDEKFMPAEGKTPLTSTEVKLIKWWIENGLPGEGNKWVEQTNLKEVLPLVTAFLDFGPIEHSGENVVRKTYNYVPNTVNEAAINNLRELGVNVRIMLHDPILLDIKLPPQSGIEMEQLKPLLMAISKNVIWLNISDNDVSDNALGFLADLTNLEKLRLEKNLVTDAVTKHLNELHHLEAINLNQTGLTEIGLDQLKSLPALKRVYHWQTKLNSEETKF